MSQTTALLRKANLAVERLIAERTRKLGLTSRQSQILLALRKSPGMTASELGRFLGVEKTTMAHVVRRMVKLQLLRQAPRKGDGRAEGNSLTAQGKRKATAVAAIEAQVDRMVSNALPGINLAMFDGRLEVIANLWTT